MKLNKKLDNVLQIICLVIVYFICFMSANGCGYYLWAKWTGEGANGP